MSNDYVIISPLAHNVQQMLIHFSHLAVIFVPINQPSSSPLIPAVPFFRNDYCTLDI